MWAPGRWWRKLETGCVSFSLCSFSVFFLCVSLSLSLFLALCVLLCFSQDAISFETLVTPSLSVGCCCRVSQLLFNVTVCVVLRASRIISLGKCSLLALWRRSRLQMSSFAKIPILDPALFDNRIQYTASWSGFQRLTQGIFCGTVQSSWGSSSSGRCHFFFPHGFGPLPKMDWEFHEIHLWKIYSFQLYGISVYSIISGLIGIPPECPDS